MKRLLLLCMWLLSPSDILTACPLPLHPSGSSFVSSVTIGSYGPYRFLFDTGTSTTVIGRDLADALALPAGAAVQAVSTSGTTGVTRSLVRELRAGALHLGTLPVLVAALPRFPTHGRIDGILGMNALAGRSFLFDVARRCVELDAPPPDGITLDAKDVASRIAVNIGGLHFVLDSGASFAVLMSVRARRLGVRTGWADVTTASGTTRAEVVRVPLLRAGAVVLRDVEAILAPPTGDAREDGLLPVGAFHAIHVDAARTRVVVTTAASASAAPSAPARPR